MAAIANIPSFLPSSDSGDGPPLGIMIVCSILGVAATVAGVIAWRKGSRSAARLTAASLIMITVTSLPAFFFDVPAGVKVLAALSVVLTVAIVVLMFSPQRRQAAWQPWCSQATIGRTSDRGADHVGANHDAYR